MNCEMALTTSTRMGGPRRAAKFRTVSCERRTAKFLSGPASLRNVAEFMTTRRSKRYDFKAGEGAAAKVSGSSEGVSSSEGVRLSYCIIVVVVWPIVSLYCGRDLPRTLSTTG